jgi:hypothetical protein
MPDAISAFYHPQMVTSESHQYRRLLRSQEGKLTSLPNVKHGAVANDVENERIGTPHTTVSQQAEQVTIRHSRCNDIEIEHIGKPHATVCQQTEQVRIVTGQRTTQKDDAIRRKIV